LAAELALMLLVAFVVGLILGCSAAQCSGSCSAFVVEPIPQTFWDSVVS